MSYGLADITVLATCDQSEAYEVDETHIGVDDKTAKFVIASASGCSCWDGEYDVEEYDTLADLERALLLSERQYNPSLRSIAEIIQEARATAAAKKIPRIGRQPKEVKEMVAKLLAA